MTYRYIYWGLLTVGPDENNLLTKAVKEKNYLVKIVTPYAYKTKEEAIADGMQYYFQVLNGKPYILGLHRKLLDMLDAGMEVPDKCPFQDKIYESDWPRYRLIRLDSKAGDAASCDLENAALTGRPTAKPWEKIFPVIGLYRIEKVAYSLIALPDVDDGG